jgi:hypothetical protein
METKQSNYLTMAITTDDVCGENEAYWTSLPAFASEIALARTHIASIRQHSQAQLGADTKPHTRTKDDAKKSLVRLAADSGAPASVCAETTGDLPAEDIAVNLLAAYETARVIIDRPATQEGPEAYTTPQPG